MLLSSFASLAFRRRHQPLFRVLVASTAPQVPVPIHRVVSFSTRKILLRNHNNHSLNNSTMSATTAAASRKQPPWRVPEGKPVPKLKLYNSMTRTKVPIYYFTQPILLSRPIVVLTE